MPYRLSHPILLLGGPEPGLSCPARKQPGHGMRLWLLT